MIQNLLTEYLLLSKIIPKYSSIILHDLLGKEILRMEEILPAGQAGNDQKFSVSLAGISSGVYLVKIITDEGEVVKKIVVE